MNSNTKASYVILCMVAALAIISTELAGQTSPSLAKNNIASAYKMDSLLNNYSQFTELYSPEKLFIHTDKYNYVAGEYIWFRGYLANSSQKSIIPESNYIYVEAFGDTLISRVKIKRTESGFEGNLQLPHNLKSGNYTLRAYTQWMLNYSTDFMFHKEVFVINPLDKEINNKENTEIAPLTDIMIFPESGRYFSDRFSIFAFKTFDSLGRGAQAVAELYNHRDSLIGSYKTEHNGMGWFRFYPKTEESYYIIAYRDRNETDRVDGEGKIYESDIEHLAGQKKRTNIASRKIKKVLPAPSKTGAVINLLKRENILNSENKLLINTICIEDNSNSLPNNYFLFIHDGTDIYHKEALANSPETKGLSEKTIVLNEKELPQGINHILITDSSFNIIAERLFFIYPHNPANISLINPDSNYTDKYFSTETSGKREKITYKFNLKDTSNFPLQGNFSISVTDSFLSPPNLTGDNLLSYMELSSELKGVIENPTFYFDSPIGDSPDWKLKKRAMDLLMMVQGWRYYNLPAIFNDPHYLTSNEVSKENNSSTGAKEKKLSRKERQKLEFYPKELIQTIEGKASGAFRNTKRATISILAPTINLAVSENLTKSGNFTVTDIDFPDSTNFIISCLGKDAQKGYYIDTRDFKSPPIKQINFPAKIGKNIDEDAIESYMRIYQNAGGDLITILNTAIVTASPKITPKDNPSPFNQSFDRRQFRERAHLDMYEGMSLLDYIVSSFPGLTYGPTGEDGLRSIISTRATTMLGDYEAPKVFVNRSQVQSTGDLDMYNVDDIENVAFLKGNDGFLFQSLSGVIMVTLRTTLDKNSRDITRNYNTKLYSPLGWQKPSKFYSPNYSLKEERDAVTYDTRSTLYWNPLVTTDSNGNAQVSFYTSDRLTRFHINVQGVTQDGRYFMLK